MTTKKEAPHCRYCGSANVSVDALAMWNDETSAWELSSTYESGACGDCGETMKYFDWKPATPE